MSQTLRGDRLGLCGDKQGSRPGRGNCCAGVPSVCEVPPQSDSQAGATKAGRGSQAGKVVRVRVVEATECRLAGHLVDSPFRLCRALSLALSAQPDLGSTFN